MLSYRFLTSWIFILGFSLILNTEAAEEVVKKGVVLEYDDQGRLSRKYSKDSAFDYRIIHREKEIIIHNRVSDEILVQKLDEAGHVIEETFRDGLKVQTSYNGDKLQSIVLPDESCIEYEYGTKNAIEKVIRKNGFGETLYSHHYKKTESCFL